MWQSILSINLYCTQGWFPCLQERNCWWYCGLGSSIKSMMTWINLFSTKSPPRGITWFSKTLRCQRHKKQRLYNIAKASHRRSDWDNYNRFRKQVQKNLRSARSHHVKVQLETAFTEKPSQTVLSHSLNVGISTLVAGLKRGEESACDDRTNIEELYQKPPEGWHQCGRLEEQSVCDSMRKAEILNQRFASVFTVEKAGSLPNLGVSPNTTTSIS